MELFAASNQWATRPDDERFWDLDEMHAACDRYRRVSETSSYPLNTLRVTTAAVTGREEPVLVTPAGGGAVLTHYGFGQLAARLNCPPQFLRTLPAKLTAAILSHRLAASQDDREAVILHHPANGHHVARCVTSEIYSRIWNSDVVDWLGGLPSGWRNVHAAATHGVRTKVAEPSDCLKNSNMGIRPGQEISPAGLYASDKDMFCFLINDDRAIEFRGQNLFRGFFASNSEVGDRSLRLTMFLFNDVCANHIIWGAERVTEFRIRHVGNQAYLHYQDAKAGIMRQVNAPGSNDLRLLNAAANKILGIRRPDVVEVVVKAVDLNKKQAERAYDLAVEHEKPHGNPRSAFGYAMGVTRLSQETPHQDTREHLDRQARSIMEMAF